MAAREPARTETKSKIKSKTTTGPEPRPKPAPASRAAAQGRPRSAPAAPEHGQGPHTANALLQGNYVATGLFAVCSVSAAIFPHDLSTVAALVDLVLFAAGCAAFFWAYATAVVRSRSDDIALAGLFFLSESAPREVAVRFRVVLAVQVVVAIVTASVRPFTPLAFGVLVPVLGLGLMGLWGARHGTFPARQAAVSSDSGEA